MRLASLLIIIVFSLPSPAHADRVTGFTKASSTVGKADLGSHHERFKGKEAYLERWLITLERKGGAWMQASYVLTNLGPGDGHATIDIMRYAPPLAEPTGKPEFYRWPKRAPKGDWAAKTSGLDIRIAKNTLRKTSKGIEGYMTAWGYELEFVCKPRSKSWRPGNGKVSFPGAGVLKLHTLPTGGRLTGRERTHNGEWQTFKGTCSGEHAATTVSPQKLAHFMLRFTGRAKGHRVTFMEIATPKDWAEERFGWLVVTKGGKVVAHSLNAHATVLKTRTNKVHKVPTRYRVTADGITLEVKTGKLLYREDVLGEVPKFIRSVLQLFIQPMNFYNRSQFRLQLPETKEIKGRTGLSVFGPTKRG